LFTAFGIVPDAAFKAYIDRIKDAYDEGDENVADDYLMLKAELKSQVLSRDGSYIMPSKDEAKIIALSAEFDKVILQNSELSKQLANGKKLHTATPVSGDSGEEWRSHTNTGKWAWKNIAPTTGSPHTKMVEGKAYHWCPEHKAWTIHTPGSCRLEEAAEQLPPRSNCSTSHTSRCADSNPASRRSNHGQTLQRLPRPGLTPGADANLSLSLQIVS
jgi:hypothetical protein